MIIFLYEGSEWIKRSLDIEMSALGVEVADLLGDVFYGIYHLDYKALKRVDWSNNDWIEFSLGWQSLSTYDSDTLTRLVILCHDRLIRCSIQANAHKYLGLIFHKRKNRNGNFFERHSTIENAIKKHRLGGI